MSISTITNQMQYLTIDRTTPEHRAQEQREPVVDATSREGRALQFASLSLRDNMEVVLAAIRQGV